MSVLDGDADVVDAADLGGDATFEGEEPAAVGPFGGETGEASEQGGGEEVVGAEAGDGVAGEEEDGFGADASDAGGGGGAHGDAVDGELAEFLDEDGEVVFGADGGSSCGDDDVGAVFEEGGFDFVFVVGESAGHLEDGAVAGKKSAEHGGVAIDDLGAGGGLTRVEEFVAGGDESDFGLSDDGDLGLSNAGEDADVLGAEFAASLEEFLSALDVFADASNVFAGADGGLNEDPGGLGG